MSRFQKRDVGAICGRFNHEHLGHVSLINHGFVYCKRLLILVGSAQESMTLRNPYSLETRIDVIKETFPDIPEETLMIRGLKDLTNELDISIDWGKYVKEQIELYMHKFASMMLYGNDDFRSRWFSPEDLVNTTELIVARSTIPISATMVRGFLVINNESAWQKCTDENIHSMYARLRTELMQVPVYKQIYDEIRRGSMDLDSFMKVYKELEAADKEAKLAAIQKK
jgi:nicotinamide-nucleotide adenylyltransferase